MLYKSMNIWWVGLFLCLLSSTIGRYQPILSGRIAYCELEILKLGTKVADSFNAPIGKQNWNERSHQNEIIESLGFAPWLANGIHGTKGLSLSGDDARAIHTRNNWIGKNVSDSPYAVLNHKWVYMYGDSTTRQVWASYAAPFQGNNFERNAKEWTRQYCNKQHPRRQSHPKGGDFPEEGWRGPCGVNEVTCYVSGYGDEGLLTFDWKHFPYEDYDKYLFGPEGLFRFNSTERVPDIFTVQFGIHTCWHAYPEGLYSTHLKEVNSTMLNRHIEDIRKLMKEIRIAVDRPLSPNTTVIIVTSGSTYTSHGEAIDACILRLNRIAADAAHEQGFPVLERGEIERRLMHKSIYHEQPIINPEMHLTQPSQNLIATCLLQLVNCLESTGNMSQSYDYLGFDAAVRHAPPSKPIHVP